MKKELVQKLRKVHYDVNARISWGTKAIVQFIVIIIFALFAIWLVEYFFVPNPSIASYMFVIG